MTTYLWVLYIEACMTSYNTVSYANSYLPATSHRVAKVMTNIDNGNKWTSIDPLQSLWLIRVCEV